MLRFVLLALLLAATARAEELRPILVADHDWAPFLFAGHQDAPPGLARELLDPCLEANGFRPEYQFLPINRVWPALEEGSLDLNVMSLKTDRQAWADYGNQALFVSSYRPFVAADSTLSIAELDDLLPVQLGHLAGLRIDQAYQDLIDTKLDDDSVVVVTTQEALLKMLDAGRIDAFVLPAESTLWRARELGLETPPRAQQLVLRSSQYFLTIAKKSRKVEDRRAFLEAMDACFAQRRKAGLDAAVFRFYGLELP